MDDPSLDGVAAVLFDEFHERSLDADLGLALARDVQRRAARDLRILVMSATLDGARVAAILGDAPVVESEGRAFPVETRYLGRKPDARIEPQMADADARRRCAPSRVRCWHSCRALPKSAARKRCSTEKVNDPSLDIVPLFGALDSGDQDRAISPSPPGRRKAVLATSIAETSLTIEGVRIVVDCGLARVPRYEPDVGLTRLETVRASRAAVDQRRGRAGRTEPGVCYRLWDEPQTASLDAFTRPEILSADLSSLVLDLAQWGVADPATLAFHRSAAAARAQRGARAAARTRRASMKTAASPPKAASLRALPLPPRLARLIVDANRDGSGRRAAEIAAILTERGLGGDSADLDARLDGLRRDRSPRAIAARDMARRWADQVAKDEPPPRSEEAAFRAACCWRSLIPIASPAAAATAPSRSPMDAAPRSIAAQRLSREPYLAVAEVTGTAANGRILLAAPLPLAEIEAHFGDRIESRDEVAFDRRVAVAARAPSPPSWQSSRLPSSRCR